MLQCTFSLVIITMQINDFNYTLPDKLIAKYPAHKRTDSRLMVIDKSGQVAHACFNQLLDYLKPGDLLVLNDTRVLNARLYGHKPTGAKVEIMVERLLDDKRLIAQLKANKPLKVDGEIQVGEGVFFVVESRESVFWSLRLEAKKNVSDILDEYGHVPLPPYFKREDESLDKSRYQTVYAKNNGSVAAPTAGLHFDHALLAKIKAQGVGLATITLHVGAGTYQPIRESLNTHQMHSEYCTVDDSVCQKINETKAQGGRVIAVGTTTTRALESAAIEGTIKPFFGETNIFIKPGVSIKCVDALITNFHLPKSSLLVLVCAFSSVEYIKAAYEAAIVAEYRFYSYGDAMLIFR